jgi:hypothetical protein
MAAIKRCTPEALRNGARAGRMVMLSRTYTYLTNDFTLPHFSDPLAP